MAKIYLSRLVKKYNLKPGEITGYNYRKLMKDILTNESENMAKMTMRISNDNFFKQISKVKDKTKKMILPDISEAFPKRSVFMRKGAIDGDVITNKLRDQLTNNLRESLNDFKTKFIGEPAFIRRRGKVAGTINPKVIDNFEKSIKESFKNYTKIHPKYGMPSNIHTIAVTEIRSTINPMKYSYNQKLYEINKDRFDFFKRWIQNKILAKEPRLSHDRVNGKKVKINEYFLVPRLKKVKGKYIQVGVDRMLHPHDINAHESQVIGCNCDVIIYAVPKRK